MEAAGVPVWVALGNRPKLRSAFYYYHKTNNKQGGGQQQHQGALGCACPAQIWQLYGHCPISRS